MYLVQLLLPVFDNAGRRFTKSKMNAVKTLLTRTFGGITMYKRSPAEGLIVTGAKAVRDDIVIFEVMTAKLKKSWWTQYRHRLEKEFRQDKIIVRAAKIRLL